MRDLPLACSLDAPALADRLEEMRAVGSDAFLSAEADGVLRFRASPDTRARLERIVAAEAACCPFLGLRLEEEPDALLLTISAPEGAEPVVAALVEALSG
jgi:hypothetical protein